MLNRIWNHFWKEELKFTELLCVHILQCKDKRVFDTAAWYQEGKMNLQIVLTTKYFRIVKSLIQWSKFKISRIGIEDLKSFI